MDGEVALDTETEIENLWNAQGGHDAVIVTYLTEAAAWCLTAIFDQYVMVPKMVNSSKYGIGFALDFFESSYKTQTRLHSVFSLDDQPVCVLHHKSLIFIGTSSPGTSQIVILDSARLNKIGTIDN